MQLNHAASPPHIPAFYKESCHFAQKINTLGSFSANVNVQQHTKPANFYVYNKEPYQY